MEEKTTVKLETDRLILRRFEIEDVEDAYKNWMSSARVCKFLTWGPYDDIDKTEFIIKFWIEKYKEENFYNWAICLKNGGDIIGNISADINEEIKEATIGYCLGEKWWSQGYMTEALQALIKFFFEERGLKRVECRHSVENPGSGRVMEKSGMLCEGVMRKKDHSNYGITDLKIYSILYDDYMANKK